MANDLNIALVLRARAEQAKAELAAVRTGLKTLGEAGREAGREGAQGSTEHARALEALRARFNPLFAASRAYEAELHDIAAAERLGAISAREAAAARERSAASMAPLNAGFVRMGASANAARAHVANLSFQLSDIAMMTAAGQNPLMLAAQQGAQVTQVFGQMRAEGIAIGPALARSFGMFLNPLSLAAMGVIAFGAAAVQWFLKADAAAVPLEETTERLAQSMGALREATREALVPMRELREEWGAQAGAVRGLRGEQALLA